MINILFYYLYINNMSQPQTASYEQNQMIECSRLSSIEHQSKNDGNNAIFTNKIGSGIQLNVGDTVSIHAAMVSEVGAGSETIANI
jgi:hypothetical protein